MTSPQGPQTLFTLPTLPWEPQSGAAALSTSSTAGGKRGREGSGVDVGSPTEAPTHQHTQLDRHTHAHSIYVCTHVHLGHACTFTLMRTKTCMHTCTPTSTHTHTGAHTRTHPQAHTCLETKGDAQYSISPGWLCFSNGSEGSDGHSLHHFRR